MFKLRYFSLTIIMALISGCSTVQTSSGRAYLDRYENILPVYKAEEKKLGENEQRGKKKRKINELIRQAAEVEPTLRFPARIGIARVENGSLTVIPMRELEGWKSSREKMDNSFGEFVPVSPMIASLTAASLDYRKPRYSSPSVEDVINEVRIGAARQHLDAVLIYEVFSRENSDSNILTIGTISIIGGYILPSKSITIKGFANALLIDVLQGYPYGTANATLDKSEMSTSFGLSQKSRKLSEEIKTEVTLKLISDVEGMFNKLRLKLLQSKMDS